MRGSSARPLVRKSRSNTTEKRRPICLKPNPPSHRRRRMGGCLLLAVEMLAPPRSSPVSSRAAASNQPFLGPLGGPLPQGRWIIRLASPPTALPPWAAVKDAGWRNKGRRPPPPPATALFYTPSPSQTSDSAWPDFFGYNPPSSVGGFAPAFVSCPRGLMENPPGKIRASPQRTGGRPCRRALTSCAHRCDPRSCALGSRGTYVLAPIAHEECCRRPSCQGGAVDDTEAKD